MRVVVTGGGGYVGYHVGWALSRGGHHVTLYDLTAPDPEWEVTAPQALRDALPPGFWGQDSQHPGCLEFVKGSITVYEDLLRCVEGAAVVVHSASFGMSGREQLSPHAHLQEKVNVGGTRKVIQAAVTSGVSALIYTSTYNVVFGGEEILNGDETTPLFPLHAHIDHYSRTKAIAEMLVLMADGKCSSTTTASARHPLRTCALRMNGVMGLGERKHTTRVIHAIRSGLLILAYGRKDELTDFIGIQNVVQAHVKAMKGLLAEHCIDAQNFITQNKMECPATRQESCCFPGFNSSSPTNPHSQPRDHNQNKIICLASNFSSPSSPHTSPSLTECKTTSDISDKFKSVYSRQSIPFTDRNTSTFPVCPTRSFSVSGQAFFISDEAPVSTFEYFRPLHEGLGYTFPAFTLPMWLILAVAHLQAFIYSIIYSFFPFNPFLTPAEVYKSGVTHYCSSRKATETFGYHPTRPNDLRQVVEYYRDHGYYRTNKATIVSILSLALFLILPIFLFIVI